MPHFSVKPIFPEVIAMGQLPDFQKYREDFEKCVEHDSKIEGAVKSNSLDPNNLKHSSCPNEKDKHGLNASEGIRLYLRPLIDALTEEITEFASVCFGIEKDRANWFCNVAWYNISGPGGFQYTHNHTNSFLTVTYYFDLPEGSVATRLHRPRIDMRPTFTFEPTIANEVTFQNVVPDMKNDTYLIFPSYLNHEVPPNGEIKGTRRTLALNFIPDRIDMDSYIIELKK